MIRIFTSLLFFSFCLTLTAQNTLQIGQWRSYLPFRGGVSVTQSPAKIIYGTADGILTITKEDEVVEFTSKEDGLSEIDVKIVHYHDEPEGVIVVYQNSNIDIITDDGIKNLNNISANNIIIGSKEIHQVYTNGQFAYFSAGFGLVQLDLETKKFGFTLATPNPVNASVIHDNRHYIATDIGMYYFDLDNPGLISDFANWTLVGESAGLPEDHVAQEVAVYNGLLYGGINGELYAEDDGWYFVHAKEGFTIDYLSPGITRLMAGFTCDANCIDRTLFFDENGFRNEAGFGCNDRPTFSIETEDGKIYYADRNPEFRIGENPGALCDKVKYNTPRSADAQDLALANDGTLFVASGSVNGNFGSGANRQGFYVLEDGQWTNYNQFENDQIKDLGLIDFWQIEVLPDKSKVFMANFGEGLVEYDFENFKLYDQDNSIISGANGDIGRQKIAGMALDDDLNLWFLNYSADDRQPLMVLQNDGVMRSFSPFCDPSSALFEVVIDHRGYKWMLNAGANSGVIVYDDNGTLDNVGDDRCMKFSENDSALPTDKTYSIAVDLDGDIWVGTEEGPVIFDGNADIFEGDHSGFQIKIVQDGITALLLVEEEILSIAVDGGNRKWMGTRNGIFVQSSNGEDEVAYFSELNSPLLDNQVNDMVINQQEGIVWISTNAGITSLRTDATVGKEFHVKEEVYAFPNPVRENYDGPIAIKGLARDANVKITDIHGKLIYETTANGGQAIWDGANFEGRKAATGVYLVYSTSVVDGFTKPDAFVTKILFVE